MSERHESGDGRERDGRAADRRERGRLGDWLAIAIVRWTLVIVGVGVLLFALGRAFGVPLFAWIVEALATETGRWLVVAFAALLVVVTAVRLRRPR